MPCPGAGVRHRGPAGPRNPRRGGWADGTTKALVGRLARERCPALRSAGLFGSETGPQRPRAGVPGDPAMEFVLRSGRPHPGSPIFSCKENVGVGFAGVVGGPNPACGPHAKKSLRPQPQKTAPAGAAPASKGFLQKDTLLSITNKEAPGAAQRPTKKEPAARLCPAGVQAAKKPPPPGPSRYQKGFFRRPPFCLSPKKKPPGLLNAPQKKRPSRIYFAEVICF